MACGPFSIFDRFLLSVFERCGPGPGPGDVTVSETELIQGLRKMTTVSSEILWLSDTGCWRPVGGNHDLEMGIGTQSRGPGGSDL